MEPKVIKSEIEYEAALAQVSELMDAQQGTPRGDSLELWSLLVDEYERQHHNIDTPDLRSAIEFRLEQQGLTFQDLGPSVHALSLVDVLAGRTIPSLDLVQWLHRELGIPADVLLQPAAFSDIDTRPAA